MLNCYVAKAPKHVTPIHVVLKSKFAAWLLKQDNHVKNWLESSGFRPEPGMTSLIPDAKSKLSFVLHCAADTNQFWSVGSLPVSLPEGVYAFQETEKNLEQLAIVWGLGAYQFTKYKKANRKPAQLLLTKKIDASHITNMVESIYLVRDLINTSTEHLGPSEFAAEIKKFSTKNKAQYKQIVGSALLKQNFPLIHAVGRGCDDEPRLIDLTWGNKKHPLVTLVGKGVCFDTGGLDIKNSSGMLLMKKDMGGAAHVLGLANMIIHAKLPIRLRVLIPLVENSISGNSYRPSDVITSRKGITVEIGNTDAEGRLVLADALAEAVNDKPDLLIDIATLTGAARIALGTDLPGLFCNNDKIAADMVRIAHEQSDPVWHMPLFAAYRESLNSNIADINNAGIDSYAGAITAALFLKEFVGNDTPWMHFDLMAWNLRARPGRPQGGEAMALRALFEYLKERY